MTTWDKIRSRDYDRLNAFGVLKGLDTRDSSIRRQATETANNIARFVRHKLNELPTDSEDRVLRTVKASP